MAAALTRQANTVRLDGFYSHHRPCAAAELDDRPYGPLSSDLDWSTVGEIHELQRIDEDEVARVWSGTLRLDRPTGEPDGGESANRLVVAEWESLPHDEPVGDGAPVERYMYIDRFGL